MKLTSRELQHVKAQLGINPVPESHESHGQLVEAYGEHTFFVDKAGLGIFVQQVRDDVPPDWGTLVIIAAWSDETRTALNPTEPKVTTTSVNLSGAGA